MSKMSQSEAGRLGGIKTKELYIARYLENPSICKSCSKELSYKQRRNKFCGSSCSASFNNKGVSRNTLDSVKPKYSDKLKANIEKTQTCIQCLFEFNNKKKRKYCSLACQQKYQWEQRKIKILEQGEEKSVKCSKRFLLETRGHQCEICKITEWQGQEVPLVMDHIDGHSENNRLVNLRLVCGNCDMQLPTYKNKNKGKGRFYRRIRYAMKKSY